MNTNAELKTQLTPNLKKRKHSPSPAGSAIKRERGPRIANDGRALNSTIASLTQPQRGRDNTRREEEGPEEGELDDDEPAAAMTGVGASPISPTFSPPSTSTSFSLPPKPSNLLPLKPESSPAPIFGSGLPVKPTTPLGGGGGGGMKTKTKVAFPFKIKNKEKEKGIGASGSGLGTRDKEKDSKEKDSNPNNAFDSEEIVREKRRYRDRDRDRRDWEYPKPKSHSKSHSHSRSRSRSKSSERGRRENSRSMERDRSRARDGDWDSGRDRSKDRDRDRDWPKERDRDRGRSNSSDRFRDRSQSFDRDQDTSSRERDGGRARARSRSNTRHRLPQRERDRSSSPASFQPNSGWRSPIARDGWDDRGYERGRDMRDSGWGRDGRDRYGDRYGDRDRYYRPSSNNSYSRSYPYDDRGGGGWSRHLPTKDVYIPNYRSKSRERSKSPRREWNKEPTPNMDVDADMDTASAAPPVDSSSSNVPPSSPPPPASIPIDVDPAPPPVPSLGLDSSGLPPPPSSSPPPAPPPDTRLLSSSGKSTLPARPGGPVSSGAGRGVSIALPSKPVVRGPGPPLVFNPTGDTDGAISPGHARFSPPSGTGTTTGSGTGGMAPLGNARFSPPSMRFPPPSGAPGAVRRQSGMPSPPSRIQLVGRDKPLPQAHLQPPPHTHPLPPNPSHPHHSPHHTQTKSRQAPQLRSRSVEKRIYGHVFAGCGSMADYNITRKLGEGTFGEVHKAIHRSTTRVVALKRILMHNEKEGMPVTALREIKILKALMNNSHRNHGHRGTHFSVLNGKSGLRSGDKSGEEGGAGGSSIIEILDMIVVPSSTSSNTSAQTNPTVASNQAQIYMVFPYMDHDLAGLLENDRAKLNPSQIKLYMKQLLEGTEYMHRNNILHRDMKAANLLISNDGSLRIADFGLARAFHNRPAMGSGSLGTVTGVNTPIPSGPGLDRKYTNCVVTRWYRPPELLLGARDYGGEVDIWGVGCVLGEMFTRRPILPGTSDMDQLDKIWTLCGAPNQHTWPHYDELPGVTIEGAGSGATDGGVGGPGPGPNIIASAAVKRFGFLGGVGGTKGKLRTVFVDLGPETLDLMEQLLTCNPQKRITAGQALEHDYFWTDPMPADPKTLPTYEASHEFDKRSHRQQQQHNPNQSQNQNQHPPHQNRNQNHNRPPISRHDGHGPYPSHGNYDSNRSHNQNHPYPNTGGNRGRPGPGQFNNDRNANRPPQMAGPPIRLGGGAPPPIPMPFPSHGAPPSHGHGHPPYGGPPPPGFNRSGPGHGPGIVPQPPYNQNYHTNHNQNNHNNFNSHLREGDRNYRGGGGGGGRYNNRDGRDWRDRDGSRDRDNNNYRDGGRDSRDNFSHRPPNVNLPPRPINPLGSTVTGRDSRDGRSQRDSNDGDKVKMTDSGSGGGKVADTEVLNYG